MPQPPAPVPTPLACTAFAGMERIASGPLVEVARIAKPFVDAGSPVLIFDDATAEMVEVDFRGQLDDMLQRLAGTCVSRRTAGRPRLGVVGREVTLLPRQWDWLNTQPGGASVALRKIVDQARRSNVPADRMRRSQDLAFRFMSAVAGDQPGFEAACRALFAGNCAAFEQHTRDWSTDVRDYAAALGADALNPA